MSSESVYGLTAPIGKTVVITKNTPLHPADNYGVSKARAEADLQALADDSFKVAILRPPMIYGKDCKGNYVTMAKLAKKLPVFPYVSNQRSMLYIENLSGCSLTTRRRAYSAPRITNTPTPVTWSTGSPTPTERAS